MIGDAWVTDYMDIKINKQNEWIDVDEILMRWSVLKHKTKVK